MSHPMQEVFNMIADIKETESTILITGETGTGKGLAAKAIHELGHAFNLKHCKDPACIMHYCRNLNDVDQK